MLLESAARGLATRPTLSPAALAKLVGTPGPETHFRFGSQKFDLTSGELLVSVFYTGSATFLREVSEPEPIPEPTSLLLLGPALVGAGLHRRRQRAQFAPPLVD